MMATLPVRLRRFLLLGSVLFGTLTISNCSYFRPADYIWPPRPYDVGETEYHVAPRNQFIAFKKTHLQQVQTLDSMLTEAEIIYPVEQLLRQGTDWQDLELPPFALPPDSMYAAIIPTLKVLQNQIVPLIGPVEIVSAYRSPEYNVPAGGAAHSRHLYFDAVDVVPLTQIPERVLKKRLRQFWYEHGEEYHLGMGLYDYRRFHIDTWRYRNWGDWPGENGE